MEPVSIERLARAVGARCGDQQKTAHISTDSRDITPGCLFVCIEGERLDGHVFARDAVERGAAYVVARRMPQGVAPERVWLVPDTMAANIALAGEYRKEFAPLCVGVTGSVGKTTTKELIAAVLSRRFHTLKTPGNRNNEIGVPAALLELTPDTQAMVIEMGMTAPGDVLKLSRAARPDVAVVTWIGTSHIERLGSRENILRAKLEIAGPMRDGAPLLVCADNDLLGGLRRVDTESGRARLLRYGLEASGCDVRGEGLRDLNGETAFSIVWDGGRCEAVIPAFGRHNVLDALAAFAVGVQAGLDPEEAAAGLRDYAPAGMRQKIVDCAGVRVVEDCYNASPDSVDAALRAFAQMDVRGRRIAVLGDMLELGETALAAHRAAGVRCAREGLDALCAVGEFAGELADAAHRAGLRDAAAFESKEALARSLTERVRPGDAVWFKASRGVKLEEAVQALYEGLKARAGA